MTSNPQKTEKPYSKFLPIWIAFGVGGIVFTLALIGAALLQFFLQFTLAAGSINTSEFWQQGIMLSFFYGTAFGIPLAIVFGFFAGFITWLLRWLKHINSRHKELKTPN